MAVDHRGIVRLSNRPADELFGYSSDEMAARPVDTFIRGRAKHNGSFAAGVRKDGSQFPVDIALRSIATDDGLLMLAVLRDASETEPSASAGVAARIAPSSAPPDDVRPDPPATSDQSHRVNNALAGIANYASLATANLHREILRGDLGGCEDFSSVLADLGRINEATRAASLLVNPPADSATRGIAEGATVLLVDDDPAVRESTRRLLELEGYDVLEASDAHGALAVSRTHPGTIDLLLTDFVMPGGGGVELQAAIAGALADTKVLFMTGHGAEALAGFGVSVHDEDVIRKPFSAEALYFRVAEALLARG